MSERTRRPSIALVGREIPRDEYGDPNFPDLLEIQESFTEAEIVILVNFAIYTKEYSRVSHQKYGAKIREMQKPVKVAAKRLFPGISYINLTEAQLDQAIAAAYPKARPAEGAPDPTEQN